MSTTQARTDPRVLAEYTRRETDALKRYAQWLRNEQRWRTGLLLLLVMAVTQLWLVVRERQNGRLGLVAAVLALAVVPAWLGARRRKGEARRQATFYEGCLERASGRRQQTGRTGEAFAGGGLYSRDLEVFGAQSLFGMLATTRTEWGERALAQMLLGEVEPAVIRARQVAVAELAPNVDLREAVALLGASEFETAPAKALDSWLARESTGFAGWVRWALLATTLAWMAVLIVGLLQGWPGGILLRNLFLVWGAQMLVSWRVRPEVLRELESAKRLGAGLGILREGLAVLDRQEFKAERLRALRAAAGGDRKTLRRLERVLVLVEQRETGWIFALGLFVAAGTQEAIALTGFRQRQGAALRAQVAAWAEFEGLMAAATYAGEHDRAVMPEVVESEPGARFDAEGLRHVLLPWEVAVGNEVRLVGGVDKADDGIARFLLVSGSNMAGKSTLLRAVGLSVVLARTGAPVPAERVRMTALRVGASIGVEDSLAEGRSKFLAEVERLRGIVTLAREHPGEVLFLVDEVLSGTNSADRRTAAEAVVRGLVAAGAIGAMSTHDLKLAEIAEEAALGGANVHMASAEEADPLGFDYLLKPGVNRTTNGLAIVRMLGLLEQP